MLLSEIQQIAKVAERACSATINHPRSGDLREDLFDVLRDVVELARVDVATQSAHLHDLLCQTSVWAEIVRCRIDILRSDPAANPVVALITYPARDLKQLLSQLIGELEHPSDAREGIADDEG